MHMSDLEELNAFTNVLIFLVFIQVQTEFTSGPDLWQESRQLVCCFSSQIILFYAAILILI